MFTKSSTDSERVHFTPAAAHAAMCEIIARLGYTPGEQKRLADHMLDAALCGYEYSGMPKVLELAGTAKAQSPRVAAEVVYSTPVSALYDGGNTVGMLVLDEATDRIIEAAGEHGFGVVGAFNTYMTGRSAYFVERIARAGLIGMHTVASFPIVAPPGASRPAVGTNPIAFGFPTTADPLLIDLGTSAFMMTELALVERRGGQLPEGVAIDKDGHPTRDPSSARAGALLHFAGYRGFAIGLAMQALGVMAGAMRSPNRDCGYLLLAMRPDLLVPLDEYRRGLTETLDRIRATPLQAGASEVRIPSERSFRERRRNMQDGIWIDRRIWERLQEIGR